MQHEKNEDPITCSSYFSNSFIQQENERRDTIGSKKKRRRTDRDLSYPAPKTGKGTILVNAGNSNALVPSTNLQQSKTTTTDDVESQQTQQSLQQPSLSPSDEQQSVTEMPTGVIMTPAMQFEAAIFDRWKSCIRKIFAFTKDTMKTKIDSALCNAYFGHKSDHKTIVLLPSDQQGVSLSILDEMYKLCVNSPTTKDHAILISNIRSICFSEGYYKRQAMNHPVEKEDASDLRYAHRTKFVRQAQRLEILFRGLGPCSIFLNVFTPSLLQHIAEVDFKILLAACQKHDLFTMLKDSLYFHPLQHGEGILPYIQLLIKALSADDQMNSFFNFFSTPEDTTE
ncbi:hypothetical protein MBANPS3_007909 [Mucor bainieri]